MEYRTNYDSRCTANLRTEVALLTEENENLKRKINEMEKKISEEREHELCLDHENFHLKHNLSAVERMSRSMKFEKDQVLNDAELELTKMQKTLRLLEIEKNKTDQNNFDLSNNLSELQHSTKMIESNLQESQDLIGRLQDDKLRLSQRIEKLTANERVLVLEIERHKRHNKCTKSRDSMSQVEQYMRGIEEDRDYWKREAALLRELGKKGTVSPSHSSVNKSPKKHFSKEKKLQELEREKEELKQKLETIRQEKTTSPVRNRSPSPQVRSRSPSKSVKSEEDIVQVKRERDDLRNLLNKLEKRVGEIQSSVKLLTQEKDRYCQMYEDSRKEVHRMHQELVSTQEDGGRANSQIKKMMNRVETERDGLQHELARVQNERDSLLEKFKATVETANQDKYLFEQKIEDLSNTIKNSRTEKKDMTERMDNLRSRILDLETELKNLEIGARQNMSELENKKEGCSQLKQQLKKTEMHLDSTERQVVCLTSQLSKSEERCALQEEKIKNLVEDLKIHRDDYSRLRSEANRLDEDKDQLKSTLSEASHRIHQLESDVTASEDELQRTRDHLCVAEQQLGRVSEILATREKENRQLRKKTDQSTSQCEESQRKIGIMSRDNDRLMGENIELQRINKNLQNDLQELVDERDDLRAQIQNYLAEVKAAEDLLAQREQDQNELLNQYQSLSEDANLYKHRLEIMQKDFTTCKQELADRENDIDNLHSKIDELEKEVTERKFYGRDLESKISHLGIVANQNKDQIKLIQHERDELMEDLSALRDLCGRLERSKEELEKDIDNKTLDIEQMQANIDDLENENESLKEEVQQKEENIKNIETILQSSRNQEQTCTMEIQDKMSEIKILNDRLQINEERLQQTDREIFKLKSRNNDLEREAERLQRCLSNEKFEKDRALSELRIHSLSPTYKPSSYLANGAHRSSSPCRACSP